MSPEGVLALVAGLALISVVAVLSTSVAPGRPLREWLMRRDASRWAQPGAAPATVKRSYWTAEEYRRDSDRLLAIGYRLESETTNPPYVEPAIRLRGRRAPRRRVPIIHAVYVLKVQYR